MNGFRVVYGVLGKRAVRCLALLLCVGTSQVATAVDGSVQSRFVWSTSRPEDQQLNRARLEAMRQALAERQTDGLLVIRNDAVVQEWYSGSSGPAKAHYTASLAKALVGGVALAVTLSDGRISLDDPASLSSEAVASHAAFQPHTQVTIRDGRWHLNGQPTYPGSQAEGLLMNVRMVNAVFEDRNRPDFDAEANTSEFIARIPEYVRSGMRAFTLCLQGGMPGYEGAVNSGFNPDGSLRDSYLQRVRRVVEACDREGAAVILACYYQRQDQVLRDEAAVRRGIVNVATWIRDHGFRNVLLEIANEFGHAGFDHPCLRTAEGIAELIELARRTAPDLLVAASGLGDGRLPERVARASDYLLIHLNGTPIDQMPARIAALEKYRKPIVCNEDEKTGEEGARAAERCVRSGASWGFMHVSVNQGFPFAFGGTADDPEVYAAIRRLTSQPTDAGGVPEDE